MDIRSKFGFFDFTDDNALDLWKYSVPAIAESHGYAKKHYMSFYGLLHENLLPQKFEGDGNATDILLPKITNHSLLYYAKSGGGKDVCKNDCDNSDYSAKPK